MPDTANWLGQVLAGGRFQITAQLGAGGMAFVYLALDRRANRQVVVKVPRQAMLEDPEFAGRFAREVKSLARLNHPHIVKILDVGEHQGRPFLVLEYLSGGSLRDRLTQGPRPVEELRAWLPGIASALDFCHEHDCVHRDVKPDNILFDAKGKVYLSDFGIAKVLTQAPKTRMTVLTGTGMVLGTAHYMAPELVLGQKYDGKVDQYGLAVTVYEIVSGRVPFSGNTPAAVFIEQSTKEIPPLETVVASVSRAASLTIHRALAKEASQRFETCSAFASALLATGREPAARSSMDLPFVCPSCGKTFRVRPTAASKRLRCPTCGTGIVPATPMAAPPMVVNPRAALVASVVIAGSPELAPARGRGLSRRDWLVLGGGAAAVLAAVLLGWALAVTFGKSLPADTEATDKKMVAALPAEGAYPRRALFISVCNYLYANSLHYGSLADDDPKVVRKGRAYPGSSTSVLKFLLELPPMKIPATQIVELTDGRYSGFMKDAKQGVGPQPVAPFKLNIEHAITEFLDTPRQQDRVLLLFAGHVVDIEKESYLVPLEGDLTDAGTLIPLTWLYNKLKDCRAQEKILVLDVCRFPPDRGFELPAGGEPGTGKMTEQLDERLKNPPAGVQVWTACIKDQNSIELDRGSVFLRALCGALQEKPRPASEPEQALPLRLLEKRVNAKLKELLGVEKEPEEGKPPRTVQMSRLSGMPAADGGFDPKAVPPPVVTLKSVVSGGSDPVGLELAQEIMTEISWIPATRETRRLPDFFPPFPVKWPEFYKREPKFAYKSLKELETRLGEEKDKYPVREAVVEAISALQRNGNIKIVEKLYGDGSPLKETKAKFFKEGQAPGMSIFELEKALARLEAVKEKVPEEPSKRWQAHFHYTLGKLQSRVVYLYEYNFVLAQVRGDQLPEIDPNIHIGWRVGSKPKVSISEPKVKEMVKSIGRTWKSIVDDYPDTPWAVMAKRERLTSLGLEWRPTRD